MELATLLTPASGGDIRGDVLFGVAAPSAAVMAKRVCFRIQSSYDEEEYSHGSDGEDDYYQDVLASQCRVKRRSNGAPKPTSKKSTTEWVEEENAALRRSVESTPEGADGKPQWDVIVEKKEELYAMQPPRTLKQCRGRWEQQESPGLNKGPWTLEESDFLARRLVAARGVSLSLVAVKGFKWAKCAEDMHTGRSDNTLKNKCNSIVRKQNISDEDRAGPDGPLIEFIEKLKAAPGMELDAAPSQQKRRRQRAASEERDGNASPGEASPAWFGSAALSALPRFERPRRQAKAPRFSAAEQAAPASDDVNVDQFPPVDFAMSRYEILEQPPAGTLQEFSADWRIPSFYPLADDPAVVDAVTWFNLVC